MLDQCWYFAVVLEPVGSAPLRPTFKTTQSLKVSMPFIICQVVPQAAGMVIRVCNSSGFGPKSRREDGPVLFMTVAIGDKRVEDEVASERIKSVRICRPDEIYRRENPLQRMSDVFKSMAWPLHVDAFRVDPGISFSVRELVIEPGVLHHDASLPEVLAIWNDGQ